jgi:2-keto-4-pentenoate hydratase
MDHPTNSAPTNSAHDDRLDAGMRRQRALLASAEADGATQAGWKAGLGTATWRATFGLDAPLVGFLLDRTQLAPGTEVAIGAWTNPRAEAEVALRMGSDVAPDATPEAALAAVDGFAPAIELVDTHPAPEDPVEILACGVYHRHWITGAFVPMPPVGALSGLVSHVTVMGIAHDPVTDVEASTGRAGDVLAEIARIGARHGRGLQAGDVVILGAIVPPAAVAPDGTFRHLLEGHPPLEVTFTR